jgi:hypothetical protein
MGIRDWFGLAPTSKVAFVEALMKEARRQAPQAYVTYNPSEDSITMTTEKSWSTDVEPHFLAYRHMPSAMRRRALGEMADNILYQGYDPPFDEIADALRPVIHNLSSVLNSRRTFAHRPFAPLTLALAIHRPGYDRFVSEDLLASWGLDLNGALARAFANLAAANPSADFAELGGFYATNYHDLYDSSRLFMPEVLGQLAIHDPIAVVLSRRCLCVASRANTEGLRAMARFVEEAFVTEPARLSTAPLERRGEDWQPLPAQEGEIPEFARLRVAQAHWDYEVQRIELEARNEAEGIDIYVSQVDVWSHDGVLVTATSWSPGIPTLLARTDVVFFAREGSEEMMIRTFADFETACGPFAAEPDSYPIRYRVLTPPPVGTLARLVTDFTEP